jgi:hypothetical protein
MTKTEAKPVAEIVNELFSKSPDWLRELVRAVMQEMLEAEMTDALGAEKGPNFRQIDEAVDLAQEVIVRDMTLKAEAVEQRLLHHPPFAHHRPNLPRPRRRNQRTAPRSSGVFQRNRRIADIADRGLGRLNWAVSAPAGVASARTGVRAKAAIQLQARII